MLIPLNTYILYIYKTMNIIFDLDGTIITQIKLNGEYTPIERPFLKPVMKWAFRNCNSVAIWTAAKRVWFNKVDILVLKPILDELKKEDKKDYSFVFIKTAKDTPLVHDTGNRYYYVKPLQIVWRDDTLPHTQANTLIIDDTPKTYQGNKRNAMAITRYNHGDECMKYDNGLLILEHVLKRVKGLYEKCGDITKI